MKLRVEIMIVIDEKTFNKMPDELKSLFIKRPNPSKDEVVKLFPSDGEDSASRFFYTAKASQTERNWGLSQFEEDVTTDGRTKPIDNAFNRGETKRKNIHPTVKPIDLMRYLVRLVTPKGGLCLDPFMGSGTTAIACKAEKINYVGCELEEEYVKIAESRIKSEVVMYDIFDFMD